MRLSHQEMTRRRAGRQAQSGIKSSPDWRDDRRSPTRASTSRVVLGPPRRRRRIRRRQPSPRWLSSASTRAAAASAFRPPSGKSGWIRAPDSSLPVAQGCPAGEGSLPEPLVSGDLWKPCGHSPAWSWTDSGSFRRIRMSFPAKPGAPDHHLQRRKTTGRRRAAMELEDAQSSR